MRAFRVAYDGRPYRGFQRQPDVPTVEDALFDVLRDLDVLDEGADRPPGYAAAGRTDAGVSALAQTVAFETPEWLTPAAFNGALPPDVRAWASADVDPDFHATHDADAREYVYHWHAPDADDDLLGTVLDRLVGEHDFHNLTPDETGTVRTLTTGFERDGAFRRLRFRAGGFARHLVRRLVGLVSEVVAGDASLARVDRVLGPDPVDGPEGVGPAAPEPLVLTDVSYDVAFAVDEEAAASARSVFAERRVEHATNARVATQLRDGIE